MITEACTEVFSMDDEMDGTYSLDEHYLDWYGNFADSEIADFLEGEL